MVRQVVMLNNPPLQQSSRFLIHQTMENEFRMNDIVAAAEALSMNMLEFELQLGVTFEQFSQMLLGNQNTEIAECHAKLTGLKNKQVDFSERVSVNWQDAQHAKERFYQYHVPYNNLNLNVTLNPQEVLQLPIIQQEFHQNSVMQYMARNQAHLDGISATTKQLAQELMGKNRTLNKLQENMG